MKMDQPSTDAELAAQLRALYDASEYSRGAADDFWDTVSEHTGWIVDLVEKGTKVRRRDSVPNPKRQESGRARALALSPERRREIAMKAANARWHKPQS